MLTHALGEAGSPFIVGFLIDAMENQVYQQLLTDYKNNSNIFQVSESHSNYCDDMISFVAIQRSLFLPFTLLLLGGLLFLIATKWVKSDKEAAVIS